MPLTGWEQLINSEQFNQLNAGSALASSSSLTDISAGANQAGEAFLLPASYLYAGMQLRVRANGIYSTTGSTNLTLGIYYGGIAGTALATATFGASANATNATWSMDALIRCDGTGTGGTVRTIGTLFGLTSFGPVMMPSSSASGNSVSIATGAQNILTIGAQWANSSPSNSITCYQFLVEQLD